MSNDSLHNHMRSHEAEGLKGPNPSGWISSASKGSIEPDGRQKRSERLPMSRPNMPGTIHYKPRTSISSTSESSERVDLLNSHIESKS